MTDKTKEKREGLLDNPNDGVYTFEPLSFPEHEEDPDIVQEKSLEGKIEMFFGLAPDIPLRSVVMPLISFTHFTSDTIEQNQSGERSKDIVHIWKRGKTSYFTKGEIEQIRLMVSRRGVRFTSPKDAHPFKKPTKNYRIQPDEKELAKCLFFYPVAEIIRQCQDPKSGMQKYLSNWRNDFPVPMLAERSKEEKDPWRKGWKPHLKSSKKMKKFNLKKVHSF